ncbi:MAG: hypothetical protein AAFV95_21060 [Bacteroidota bacterium]
MQHLLVTIFLSLFCGICQAQTPSDTIVLKGTIGNHFHLSSTQNIPQEQREEYQRERAALASKMKLLDRYYHLQSSGAQQEADQLLASDDVLSQKNKFGIGLLYTMAKMQELDILYKPLIQCSTGDYLISCDPGQLETLKPYLNKNKEIQLTCRYIATIPMDQTQFVLLLRADP